MPQTLEYVDFSSASRYLHVRFVKPLELLVERRFARPQPICFVSLGCPALPVLPLPVPFETSRNCPKRAKMLQQSQNKLTHLPTL